MNTLFISPHDDDNVLFGAFTCMREKPLVVVVTDSYRQAMRGEVGCGALDRMEETRKACELLGCAVFRLGVPDVHFDADPGTSDLLEKYLGCFQNFDRVYVPASQGGNKDHDTISQVCQKVFGDKVILYTTYTKTELHTTGSKEIVPTPEEMELKNKALDCFISQLTLKATRPHFDAVRGKNEFYV